MPLGGWWSRVATKKAVGLVPAAVRIRSTAAVKEHRKTPKAPVSAIQDRKGEKG